MYNLYQSKLWKKIQHEIYRKPIFTIKLFGKEYTGTIKEKSIGPWIMRRYQIMGVELPEDQEYIRSEIAKIKKQFRNKGFFFQVGIINEIISFENNQKKHHEFDQDMRQMRLGIQTVLQKNYDIYPAFRENMPAATIIYDITKSDEVLLKEMNESCRKRVKKAIAGGMEYRIIQKDQYEEFFVKRKKTANIKGFNTISKEQYEGLLKYIKQDTGMLIGAFLDGHMVAGTICLFDGDRIYCPYGFFDRVFSAIGVQHFLKFKLFLRARDHGFKYVDTGGGAPTGFDKHPLASVSTFKQSLGGTKTELFGSYDIVLNPLVYKLFKRYYTLRN